MADLFSPVKRVQMKVGEYLAMEPSADRIIIERRPKCKPSRKKRKQLQAKGEREQLSNSVPIEGMNTEVNSEVRCTPVLEVTVEKGPEASQDSEN